MLGMGLFNNIRKTISYRLEVEDSYINANNVAERLRKMSIRFSVVIHTITFMGLDLEWNKGPRDFS